MKLRRYRWVLLLVMALFMVNNVGAAARACLLTAAAHEHVSIRVQAPADDPSCPEAVATPCGMHCVQDAKATEQKAPADAPVAAFAPPLAYVLPSFRPVPARLPVAVSPVVVGPPLTILFGNLRN